MPEYPAVIRLHHFLLHLQIIFFAFWAASLGKWGRGHKQWWPLFLILKMKSAGGIPGTLFEVLFFGMDAFESTPLAFTSWLRSWRLVNCRVCNARGRMKGMQKLVNEFYKEGGLSVNKLLLHQLASRGHLSLQCISKSSNLRVNVCEIVNIL